MTSSTPHYAFHRRVYYKVELLSESRPFDKAVVHAAAHSPELFGHELTIDEVLDLYRYGRHLVAMDHDAIYR